MTLWLFTKLYSFDCSTLSTSAFNLARLKSLINFEDFLRSLNGESGRASHLLHRVDKQIARCNNSHIKILNLFEFPHVLTA